jgi:hypothetical protein
MFCILSLLTPDVALLVGSEKISVPFAGPVSFSGFVLLGPAILIALRVYLQIYVEHEHRLDRVAKRLPVERAPTLLPLKNPLMRGFGGFAFYLLLPLTALMFGWKAAVFPVWGSGLAGVAAAVIAVHIVLPLRHYSWWRRALFGASAMVVAAGLMVVFGPVHRPFHLLRANLSEQYLTNSDFRRANLTFADLRGAILEYANLDGATLWSANLKGANLRIAGLTHTGLWGANLRIADLRGANLMGATRLRQEQVDAACCNQDTKLPPGLRPGNACHTRR